MVLSILKQCSHSSASFSGSLSKPHKLHGNPMWLAMQAAKPKQLGQQLIPWSSLSSRCPVISQFLTSSQTSTKSYTQSSTQCMCYLKEFFPVTDLEKVCSLRLNMLLG
ncbi:hypothetical protein C359_00007 [Cryptococcus neoformans Bt120]|nr:hypothetical protein C359_00007 [Cryptococcus neoformans var. grubii Bt120]